MQKFVLNVEKWKGSLDQPAIEVTVEVKPKEEAHKFSQVFTYEQAGGCTVFGARSNLGKYHQKYKKLPEVGDKVKVATNNEGFAKLKLD